MLDNLPILGFIGAGKMASAIVEGLLHKQYPTSHILMADKNSNRRDFVATEFGVRIVDENVTLVKSADIIFLATKPVDVLSVCSEISEHLEEQSLIISIAAGLRVDLIEGWLNNKGRVLRAMPNTPIGVGVGVIAFYSGAGVSKNEKETIDKVFEGIAITLWLDDENLINAVTAVAGSAPAYFFLMMESMLKVGVDFGLDEAITCQMIAQTAMGASKLSFKDGNTFTQLRTDVTSSRGTTQAAIDIFQEQNFEAIVGRALRAAHERAWQIGEEMNDLFDK